MAVDDIASLLERESRKRVSSFDSCVGKRTGRAFYVGFDRVDAAEAFVDQRWQQFAVLGGALFASGVEITDQSRSPRAEAWIAVAAAGLEVDDIAEVAAVGSHNEGPPVNFDQFVEDARSMLTPESFAAMMENIDRIRAEHMRQQGPRVLRVRAALKAIRNVAEFRVRYADPAGFRAVLFQRPTEAQAEEIERIIMSVDPEAADLVDPERLATSIHRTGEFALWWD